jgi:hypothetical protein
MKKLFEDTGFRIHFAAYVVVNAILIAVNLLLTPDILWFYWPLLGWGIGLLSHGIAMYFVLNRRPSREAVVRAKLASRG